jgi:mannose-6-phosphate isomerase-like protein (cupin superfamily)
MRPKAAMRQAYDLSKGVRGKVLTHSKERSSSMTASALPAIVQPGMGRELHAFGDVLSVMLGGTETDQRLTVMFDITAPGGGPPPHVHSKEDELFLVVDGRVSFFIERDWTEVSPGGAVYLPRGTTHCYRNTGTTVSRQWILTTPSGFEHFFARCAEEFARAGGPDMQRIVGFARDNGIEFTARNGDALTSAAAT